jgi:transcriptional regulator with XRE-family HTH domain
VQVKRSTALRIFATNTRARRLALGWSQEMLAERANLNWSYLSRVERRVVNISLTNAKKIAMGLGCPLTELLKGC